MNPKAYVWLATLTFLAALALPLGLRAEEDTVYFSATGQSLTNEHGFLAFWRDHDGERMLGAAISAPLVENGLAVQYFERGRTELHPEWEGSPVVLGRIGADYAAALWRTFPSADDAPLAADAERFDATGHTLAGAFRAFWHGADGLTMLGYPLSEPTWEYVGSQMLQVQYFERGRLEYHPEQAGTTNEVMISNLGRDVALLRSVALSSRAPAAAAAPVEEAAPAPAAVALAPPAHPVAPVKAKPVIQARVREKPAAPARTSSGGSKSIVVDLSRQHLYAYEGDTVVFDTAVSTGRDGFNTPTGSFHIYAKLPMQTMEGTIGGEYYRVPNIPNVMYINGGVALHGTYWHNLFGIRRMSHGCVNLPLGAAAWLYKWAPSGTPVDVQN